MTRAALGGTSALTLVLAAAWWRLAPAPGALVSARSHAPQTPALTDSIGDGTPDFLRLTDPADRHAFVGWFTFLAELQFFRGAGELPPEVSDCSALVRFAYREALRRHTGAWASQLRLPDVPPLGSIRKYNYPFTPLKAALFRVRPGAFGGADLEPAAGAFAEFADARTLLERNTYFVTRALGEAQPGDLLFFRQPSQQFPFHVMIYLGATGRVRGDTGPFVVYHTGPDSKSPGEVRRPTVGELFAHPNPQWRPYEGNQSFLGVFRWNILNG